MKAAFIERPGPPEVIVHGDVPDPVPGPRDVLVRVRACAVNPIDTYVRSGAVAMPLPRPFVVGCDLAGEVVAVGDEVDRLRPGMRVFETSSKTGSGLDEWLAYLVEQRQALAGGVPSSPQSAVV
jgi:NADPH2:quinone reductase